MCSTMWGRWGSLTGSKSGRKICTLVLTRKHWSREPTQNRDAFEMHFLRHPEKSKCSSVGGPWLTVLLVKRVLYHGTKNIERQYPSFYFNHFFISTIWKDQNSWKLFRTAFPCFSFVFIFFKSNWFWFQKMMQKI